MNKRKEVVIDQNSPTKYNRGTTLLERALNVKVSLPRGTKYDAEALELALAVANGKVTNKQACEVLGKASGSVPNWAFTIIKTAVQNGDASLRV